MAADVCAEQLPSTSYATTTTISSSSTILAPPASREVVQVATSSATVLLGPCYMSQSATATATNGHQDDEEAGSAFAISSLPLEVYLHILKLLPRYDIDNCKFVCKRWKEIIDRNSHSLRKHLVQTLELREYKYRFILTLNSSNLLKTWTFCERVTHRPSSGLGKRRHAKTSTVTTDDNEQQHAEVEQQQQLARQQRKQLLKQQEQPAAKLPHLLICVGQPFPSSSLLPVLVPNITNDGTHNAEVSEDHDDRKRREHTPPQLVCERIAKYFHEADIHLLRLTEMRFTDHFVDRLRDALGPRKIRCKKLEISMCKLNYISSEKFHQFLQMVECKQMSLIWLRGNNGHLNASQPFLSSFLGLSFLSIFAVTPQIIIGDDKFLADFLDNKARNCPSETVLRLDNSSITTGGLCQAIDKWKQTDTRWIMNLCVVSEHIDIDDLLRHLSLNQIKPRLGAYRINHPKLLGEALLLWDDKDGLHVVSSGKSIT